MATTCRPGLDYAVFDYGVNSGTSRAARVLQRLCGLADDGRLTDAAIAAVKKRKPSDLIGALCDERLAFLKRLKTWRTFGIGWGRRVAEVRAAALAMAEEAGRKTDARTPGAKISTPARAAPTPTPGKGIVPVNGAAQKSVTGAIAVTGAAAAQQAHQAGLHAGIIISIVVVSAALALAGWLAWHWRQKRRQEA